MKIITFNVPADLINILKNYSIYCENYDSSEVDYLISNDSIYTAVVLNLDATPLSHISKFKEKSHQKQLPLLGIYTFNTSPQKKQLCNFLVQYTNFTLLAQELYFKISSILSQSHWIPIKTLSALYINRFGPWLKYEDREFNIFMQHWYILLQLALFPHKKYSTEQLLYHAFPIGKEPPSANTLQTLICQLKKFCKQKLGHSLVVSNGCHPCFYQLAPSNFRESNG